ncbi:MAG: D-alanyl-D-alanine carboxypeptidase family protein [Bacillota bacterium]|nr:D-alanyl-D-alanine carboxypeptidase family protein [Bacillota bacterium]
MLKKLISLLILFTIVFIAPIKSEEGPALNLSCKSAVLMDAATGTVLYELNKDKAYAPASITKIMTLLLAMEALSSGQISYDSIVTASERAKSMGGSTIFLDAGERMTVHDLIKGIAVASANDACVAMAEYLAGSEAEFVNKMNEKAQALGMQNTHFVNTNGLDAEGHYSSAYDVALMSKALMAYPDIFKFTTIWTDSLRDGKFNLANTNKLIRFYNGANGLKTGSTSGAGCCISAAALRDGMQLIAVVMNAPTSADRFQDARTLLDYGFATYCIWQNNDVSKPFNAIKVNKGEINTVNAVLEHPVSILLKKSKAGAVTENVTLPDLIAAPVKKGQSLGTVEYFANGESVAKYSLVASCDVARISYKTICSRLFKRLLFNA